VVALLARVPLFATLAEEDLEEVAHISVPREFDTGESVFRQGDDSDTCYVVHVGRVRAVRGHTDGRQITVAVFASGEIFGELALFEDERRGVTVEALEPTSAIALLGSDMRRLMDEHTDIALKFVVALSRRLREANVRLARHSFQTVPSRVAAALGELVEQAQEHGQAEHDVLITATQADLAQLAGSSRESASRFLAVLDRAGVITQRRGRLVVHDAGALQGYVF
jgi:CRP-like cAMP-binding protein